MHEVVYVLCAATSILCMVLLARSHRRNRSRLALWSALCFAGLAVNNLLLVVDLLVVRTIDLSIWRTAVGCAAILLLVVGLIRETE